MIYTSKHGLSAVIATVMLVLLAIVLIGFVWVVVNDLVNKSIDESSSCFDVFDKVNLNSAYTCYNSSSNEMQFSININDINVDNVLISISAEGQRKTITLTNEEKRITYLRPYNGIFTDNVSLPGENSGKTYDYDMNPWVNSKPDLIEIAPTVGGNQCDVTDSITEVVYCA